MKEGMNMYKGTEDKAKKEFDPAMSFSVFGTWVDMMERLEATQGVEAAYSLFKAIANYSRYCEEPDFETDSFANIVWPVIKREIDLSLKRRGSNFSSEEADERRKRVISAHMKNPSMPVREIADATGVPKSTVDRILQQLKKNGVGPVPEPEAVSETEAEAETEPEVEPETEAETEPEIDTTGHEWDGTVGQESEAEQESRYHSNIFNSLDLYSHIPAMGEDDVELPF